MDHLEFLKQLSQADMEAMSVAGLDAHVEQSQKLICIADHQKFLKLNAAWEKVLGWTKNELMARPWITFVHPDDVSKTHDIAEAQKETNVVNFVNRYRHKDGRWIPLRWMALQWDRFGRTYAIAETVDG